MQGYTNRHLRAFYRCMSSSSTTCLWTEMEKFEDLLDLNGATRRLAHDDEQPTVLQLGGNCPVKLRGALAIAATHRYDEINLNVGCPSVETGGAHFGAKLMTEPALVAELVAAASRLTTAPISVKCRIGVHDSLQPDGTTPEDCYETLHSFVEAVTASGAVSHVVVHARAAILCGLTPARNRHVPPLRHEFVHALTRDFPALRVTLNGGIRSLSGLREHLAACANSGVDGVMVGRWLLARPLDLPLVEEAVVADNSGGGGGGGSARVCRADAIQRYARQAATHARERVYPLHQVMLPLLLAAEQLADDCAALYDEDEEEEDSGDGAVEAALRPTREEAWALHDALSAAGHAVLAAANKPTPRDVASAPRQLDTKPPLRKLHTLLASDMGKKVANKVVRNREEAFDVR